MVAPLTEAASKPAKFTRFEAVGSDTVEGTLRAPKGEVRDAVDSALDLLDKGEARVAEREASGKALEVVGDVVAEYLKHGESRKFICSAVDTAHVEELQRQFLAAGINVATYTYKDSEDDRADTTNEFKKPESAIRGLITVTAASRGFDVPDVSCVIMARPLRKSLRHEVLEFAGLVAPVGEAAVAVLAFRPDLWPPEVFGQSWQGVQWAGAEQQRVAREVLKSHLIDHLRSGHSRLSSRPVSESGFNPRNSGVRVSRSSARGSEEP